MPGVLLPPPPAHPRRRRLVHRLGALLGAVVVAASVFAGAGAATAAGASRPDQVNDGPQATIACSCRWDQGITPSLSGPVTQIDLDADSMSGDGDGTIQVTVRAMGADGIGTDDVFASGSTTVGGPGWFSVPMTSVKPLRAGTQYALSVDYRGMYLSFTDPVYAGGGLRLFRDGVASDYTRYYDLMFREYVVADAAIAGTPTTDVAVDHPYSYTYDLGGVPSTTTVVAGALPAGLTLSSAGVLSGTPTRVGTSTFTVRATSGDTTADVTSTIVVRPAQAPSAPTAVQATPGATSASVRWTAPAAAGDDPVAGYTVTAHPGGATATSTTTEATVTGLTAGTPTTFTVTAKSASGTSPSSAESEAVVPFTTPDAPGRLRVVPGDTTAALSWTAPADGSSPLTGYVVTVSADGGPATVVARPDADATRVVVPELTNGTSYVFTVAATNAAGTGPAASSGGSAPFGLPSSPRGLAATPGDSSVALDWSAPETANGSPVTGYAVQHSTDGTTWTDDASVAGTATEVTGLANGTEVAFRVAAVNAAGTGAWSGPVRATPVALPGVPQDVAVVPGDRSAAVSWTAPTIDGGSAVTGYVVQTREGTGPWQDAAGTEGTSLTVDGLENGTELSFRVAAVNAVGTGAPSASVGATPFVFVPSAVTDGGALDGRTVRIGDRVRLHATDLPAGSSVTVELHSKVVVLATERIGADGVLDTVVTIPAATAPGDHELTVTLSDTGAAPVTASFALTVAKPTPATVITAVTHETGDTVGKAVRHVGELAFTGGSISPLAVSGAVLAMALGAFVLALVRRRRV
ncbi:fibronectin type III domain-containing protein [Curtobacterium sp. MCLR17_036]|uniref:fibronectin type III domain-containing protein n=1 Tax=Curtobacterium sp. MCLR17_036 TaxID=2175620 RepID=UPI000DA7D201|nr:fibronectin type III domain-containing protein [Curtobacterium sp. MCLR17_036]WIE65104.1 fibronectin type III domain-containing protein [Curtobacterium sp. MCLR17_036]